MSNQVYWSIKIDRLKDDGTYDPAESFGKEIICHETLAQFLDETYDFAEPLTGAHFASIYSRGRQGTIKFRAVREKSTGELHNVSVWSKAKTLFTYTGMVS